MNKFTLASRPLLAALSAATLVTLAGCKKPTEGSPDPTNPPAKPELKSTAPNAPEPKLSAGDQAWKDMVKAMQAPSYPPSWDTNPPTKEALAKFQQNTGETAATLADKAKDFYTRFPDHAQAGLARDHEYQVLKFAVQSGQTNRLAALLALEDARLKDPNMGEDERLQLRVGQVQREVLRLQGDDMGPALNAMENGVRTLQKEFPKRPELAGLLLGVAQGRLESGEVDRSRVLAQEAAASESDEAKEGAQALLKKIERMGQPLHLAFKALDGREVDLKTLRGKVVLIDFWATWCRPCMEELPKVKAAYAKLRAKGFEIVGISLDEDVDALRKVTGDKEMTWPQYFEETGKENRFAGEFGIEGIPTMWLVDKKGVLRDLNARVNLGEKVEKLLAE